MTEPARRALVTGAAGFFGLAIVQALARAGTAVVATDRVSPAGFVPRPGTPPELVEYVQRDLESATLDDLAGRADGIVHAAALTPESERDGETGDALLRVNVMVLPGLLRAARTSLSCRRIILISSAGVYDQARAGVIREGDADGGTGLYGAAKLAAELLAERYASLYGLDFAAVRPTSLFGAGEEPRDSRPRVTGLARLVEHGLAGEPVRIERERSRADWLSVDDAAEAVQRLWQLPRLDGRSFNLSSGRPRPFGDVLAAVSTVTGLAVDSRATAVVDGGPDRPALIANDEIVDLLGWRPTRSLEDGVRDLVRFLTARPQTGYCRQSTNARSQDHQRHRGHGDELRSRGHRHRG